jgi:putative ABC transport system permease protein
MGTFIHDVRYGVRMLARSPGFAAIAVMTLMLGIGANTAIFSVVNAVLLRPLPFPAPQNLVQVFQTYPSQGVDNDGAAYPTVREWREKIHSVEGVGAYHQTELTLTGHGDPQVIQGATVTANLFSTLEARPLLGRLFLPEDDVAGGNPVILMGEGIWRREFGADPDIVGKTITLDKESFTVIGILPEKYRFPYNNPPLQVWLPLAEDPDFKDLLGRRGAHFLNVVTRLKPGVTLGQAQSEMAALADQLAKQFPKELGGWGVRLVPLQQNLVGDVRAALVVLLGAVGLVMLIACANVANLLLARATSRSREVAIRTALGAGRGRLIRQLLTESALLSVVGAVLGLLLAYWGVDALLTILPDNLPRIHAIRLDSWVLGFTLLLSVLASVIFGLAPAVHAVRTDLQQTLKEGGRGTSEGGARQRIRSMLVVSEVALAVVLLTGAGLLIRSFLRLQQVNPGFQPEHLLQTGCTLPQSQYAKPEQWTSFYDQLLERVRALPGVQSASVALPLPLTQSKINLAFRIDGRPEQPGENTSAEYSAISADYFRVMQIPLLRGRFFTEQDSATAPKVAIISEAMARRYFPIEDPIGKRLIFGYREEVPREIIGITGSVKRDGLNLPAPPEMYLPYAQNPWWVMMVVVRSTGDPGQLSAAVRQQVHTLDKDLPFDPLQPMTQVLRDSMAPERFRTMLLGIFGAMAVLLAAVGSYGVISYSVSQRTHEMGIRMALGAQPADLLGLVVERGLRLASLGIAIGLVAAFALARFLSTLLFGVSTSDPLTFAGVVVALFLIALAACYIPARRAMRVDPMVALRYE